MPNVAGAGALSSALQVIFVGTGTCVPRLDRRGPCTLLRCGSLSVAVDLGLGALHGLLRHAVRHVEIDALLFTHLHPDHTAELASFLFAANYDETPRRNPLFLGGGQGFGEFLNALRSTHGTWLDPKNFELTVRQISPGEKFVIGPMHCVCASVQHIPSSLAFRFEGGRKSIVISGDTGPTSELETLARGADLLVLEASLASDATAGGHLTARQAGELASRSGVGRLVLHHLYPSADRASPVEAARQAFDGPVVAAEDGMWVEL